MAGMGSGPWTRLGRFGWFISTWIVMMAAMMFPSAAPTVALYAKMSRQPSSSAFFLTGYLLTWTAAGVGAFLIGLLGPAVVGKGVWNDNGRFFTAATLLAAALYEMSPLKHVCLSKCRSPIGLLLGGWRDGRPGALRMGMRNGTWCVGCCWALMASPFALGFMSPLWMVVVAALISIEKTLPWRRVAAIAVTAVLVALGVLVIVSPEVVTAFTMPM